MKPLQEAVPASELITPSFAFKSPPQHVPPHKTGAQFPYNLPSGTAVPSPSSAPLLGQGQACIDQVSSNSGTADSSGCWTGLEVHGQGGQEGVGSPHREETQPCPPPPPVKGSKSSLAHLENHCPRYGSPASLPSCASPISASTTVGSVAAEVMQEQGVMRRRQAAGH